MTLVRAGQQSPTDDRQTNRIPPWDVFSVATHPGGREDDQRFRWSAWVGSPRRNRTGDPILTIKPALRHEAWGVCG
jgi:hypothetical protein